MPWPLMQRDDGQCRFEAIGEGACGAEPLPSTGDSQEKLPIRTDGHQQCAEELVRKDISIKTL